MNGCLSTEDLDPESLIAKAKAWHGLVGWDLVQRVTCPNPYAWRNSRQSSVISHQQEGVVPVENDVDGRTPKAENYKVIALDSVLNIIFASTY